MDDKVYIVYQHINKINNKSYLGITGQEPTKRWGKDGQKYNECPYFWNAIQKYGWDNFDHKILYSGLTHAEACEMEKKLIAELNTSNPEIGYNISPGGDGFTSETMLERWQDETHKSNMINAMRDAWKDPEKRKRRSESAKARWADPEFKDRVMEIVRNTCKKAVQCIETGEVFDMMATAAQKYHVHRGDLTNACKNGYRCGGYHWKYVDSVS